LARNLLLIYIADFKIIKGLPGLLAIGIENLLDFFKRNKYNLDVLQQAFRVGERPEEAFYNFL
jgi:hypothetical protein